jgi:hypothetical protein
VTEPDAPVFDAQLDPEVLHFGETKPTATVCQWCGEGLVNGDLDVCPHCGALLKPSDETLEVPGVTTLAPEAVAMLEAAEEKRRRKTEPRQRISKVVSGPAQAAIGADAAAEEAALQPPDADVRRVMLELDAAARRASAPAEVTAPVPVAPEAEAVTASEPEPESPQTEP